MQQVQHSLWIDSTAGFSSDSLAAALIGLGVMEQGLIRAIKSAAEEFGVGYVDAHTHLEFLPDETLANRLHVIPLEFEEIFDWENLPTSLEKALTRVDLKGEYAAFVRRGIAILSDHKDSISQTATPTEDQTVPLPIIGKAHTPYKHKAPYQPSPENVDDGSFYIEVEPKYVNGLKSLETFNHIFVLSYLDRSRVAEITVQPPWKDGEERHGVFATRSPNRPGQIGLTRVRLHRVEGSHILTGPLDLFDGTPILDIKPFIRALDGMDDTAEDENDGWLEGSDHLELHRLGIPHTHPGSVEMMFKPQVLIPTLFGIGWGLQQLSIDINGIKCTSPLQINDDQSQGLAIKSIFEQHNIPHEIKPNDRELLSLSGAVILAGLSPKFPGPDQVPSGIKVGVGLGELHSDTGGLRLLME